MRSYQNTTATGRIAPPRAARLRMVCRRGAGGQWIATKRSAGRTPVAWLEVNGRTTPVGVVYYPRNRAYYAVARSEVQYSSEPFGSLAAAFARAIRLWDCIKASDVKTAMLAGWALGIEQGAELCDTRTGSMCALGLAYYAKTFRTPTGHIPRVWSAIEFQFPELAAVIATPGGLGSRARADEVVIYMNDARRSNVLEIFDHLVAEGV